MGGVDSQILQRLSSENPLKHINGDHNTRLLLIVVSWEGKQVRRRSYSEKMFRNTGFNILNRIFANLTLFPDIYVLLKKSDIQTK